MKEKMNEVKAPEEQISKEQIPSSKISLEREELLQNLIQELIKKLPMELSAKDKVQFEELMFKIIEQQMVPKEAMGFSDEMIEHMYAYGFRLYNNGNYKKAKEVFTSLRLFQPGEARFVLGEASSLHRLSQF